MGMLKVRIMSVSLCGASTVDSGVVGAIYVYLYRMLTRDRNVEHDKREKVTTANGIDNY